MEIITILIFLISNYCRNWLIGCFGGFLSMKRKATRRCARIPNQLADAVNVDGSQIITRSWIFVYFYFLD